MSKDSFSLKIYVCIYINMDFFQFVLPPGILLLLFGITFLIIWDPKQLSQSNKNHSQNISSHINSLTLLTHFWKISRDILTCELLHKLCPHTKMFPLSPYHCVAVSNTTMMGALEDTLNLGEISTSIHCGCCQDELCCSRIISVLVWPWRDHSQLLPEAPEVPSFSPQEPCNAVTILGSSKHKAYVKTWFFMC